MKAKLFISKNPHKGRIYKITICTEKNPLLLKRHVIKMFREYCRFAETVKEYECRLVNYKKINHEFEEIRIILNDSLDSNLIRLNFDQRSIEDNFDHEFVKLEILTKKNPKSEYACICEFYRKIETDFKTEIKQVSQKTQTKIESFKYTNSPEIKKTIKNFSDNFIKKWGPQRPRNLFGMEIDFTQFKKNIENIPGIVPEYLDQDYTNLYITPIELLFKNTQKYNLDEVSMKNELTKAIYANNPEIVSNILTKVETNINEKIGSSQITPLMFTCSRFCGHLKKEFPENSLQILNLLLMYGADPDIKDVFGKSCIDYLKLGPIVFGHEPPSKPVINEFLKIIGPYLKEPIPQEIKEPQEIEIPKKIREIDMII